MRIIAAAFALAFAAASAQAAERRYTVTDFDKVQVEGPFEVTLATGRAPAARAIGSQQALDRLTVEVQGRTLRVRANRSSWGGYPGEGSGPVKIELSGHELKSGIVNGGGSLRIDRIRAMRFETGLAGSGRVEIASIDVDKLYVNLLGSGKIALGGRTKDFRATIQGSGDLEAAGLTAKDAQVVSDTSGTVGFNATGTVSLTAQGTGDVAIAGPADCTVKGNGFGRISCGD